MKIIDKNGRLFGKISVIDLLVVLVVAVLALGLHVKGDKAGVQKQAAQLQPVTYEITLNTVPNYVADCLREGDELIETDRKEMGVLGTIVHVERTPGVSQTTYMDGTIRETQVENGSNLVLTVEGEGIVEDGRTYLNGSYELGVNANRNFTNRYTVFAGQITHIGE